MHYVVLCVDDKADETTRMRLGVRSVPNTLPSDVFFVNASCTV